MQCRYAHRVTVHNEAVEAMRETAKAAGFEVKNAEEAGWFEKDMNLRPFDLLLGRPIPLCRSRA